MKPEIKYSILVGWKKSQIRKKLSKLKVHQIQDFFEIFFVDVLKLSKKVSFCNIDSMDKDNYGWTSLIQCTKIIMDELHWFNAMNKDNYGWTPFIFACRYGHQDAVKLFV